MAGGGGGWGEKRREGGKEGKDMFFVRSRVNAIIFDGTHYSFNGQPGIEIPSPPFDEVGCSNVIAACCCGSVNGAKPCGPCGPFCDVSKCIFK